jgi:hypothetical protein
VKIGGAPVKFPWPMMVRGGGAGSFLAMCFWVCWSKRLEFAFEFNLKLWVFVLFWKVESNVWEAAAPSHVGGVGRARIRAVVCVSVGSGESGSVTRSHFRETGVKTRSRTRVCPECSMLNGELKRILKKKFSTRVSFN